MAARRWWLSFLMASAAFRGPVYKRRCRPKRRRRFVECARKTRRPGVFFSSRSRSHSDGDIYPIGHEPGTVDHTLPSSLASKQERRKKETNKKSEEGRHRRRLPRTCCYIHQESERPHPPQSSLPGFFGTPLKRTRSSQVSGRDDDASTCVWIQE